MADATVKLKVLLESVGIKATTKEVTQLAKKLKGVAAGTEKVSNAQNKLKRNLEGTAQRTGNATKDFARQAQGLGGLVQAYATVAANVFALSSAFLVLRNAADLSSQIKSAQNFSDRFGVDVVRLTKRVEEASGGAVTFAGALGTVNKAVSAGLGTEQLEKLTEAATKASQTFGGTTTEALNRFISAAQRGRVDIVQTLGIVIDTEAAYRDYAASVGKTAQELSAFDKQQAIINATILESQKVFDGVVIDPNPFQQLLSTIVDLKDNIATFATDALTPLINTFNKSTSAAAALIAVIASSVGKRIFPSIAGEIQGFAKAGLESTRAAREATKLAKQGEAKIILETERKVSNLTQKQLVERSQLFRSYYKDVLNQSKTFGKKLLNDRKQVNAAILQEQRAAIARELTARAKGTGKGLQSAFVGISTRALRNEQNRLALIASQTDKATVAQAKLEQATNATNKTMQVFIAKTNAGFKGLQTQIKVTSSTLKTGFAQGFRIAEGNIVKSIRGMNIAWLKFIRDIGSSRKSAKSALVNLASVAGRTSGVVIGALSKVLSFATTITIAISGALLIWDLFGKSLFGVDRTLDELKKNLKDVTSALEDSNERSEKFVQNFNRGAASTDKFIKNLQFAKGTIDTITTSLDDLAFAVSKATEGRDLQEFSDQFSQLQDIIEETGKIFDKELQKRGGSSFSFAGPASGALIAQRQLEAAKAANQVQPVGDQTAEQFRKQKEVAEALIKTVSGPLVNSFSSLDRVLKVQGINSKSLNNVYSQLSTQLQGTEVNLKTFRLALELGNEETIISELNKLDENKAIEVLSTITSGLEGAKDLFNAIGAQEQAIRTLQDADKSLGNFVSGIDKLKNTGPNKDLINNLSNIEQALDSAQKAAGKTNNQAEILKNVIKGNDLDNIKAIFNVTEDSDVEQVLSIVGEQLKILQQAARDGLTSADRLKTITNEIKAIEASRANTDRERISNAEKVNSLKLKELELNRQLVINEIKQLGVRLGILATGGKLQSEEANRIRASIEANTALVKSYDAQLAAAKQVNVIAEKTLEIELEKVAAITSVSQAQLQSLTILQNTTKLYREDLAVQEAIFNVRKRGLIADEDRLKLQIQQLKEDGVITQEESRQLEGLNAQLTVAKLKTQELIKQEGLLLRARQLQESGESIFSEESLEVTAEFFVQRLQEKSARLKTTFQTLGEGFGDTLISTFDKAVDNLLEGGRDFGRNVVETLKEGLRETFGEAIKNRIKESLAGAFTNIFNTPEDTSKEDEARRIAEERKTQTQKLIDAIIANTAAIKGGGTGEGVEQALPSVFKQAKEVELNGFDQLLQATSSTQTDISKLPELLGLGNQVTESVKTEVQGSGNNLIQALFSLGSTIIQALATAGSGIGSLFGFASGGMIPGGTSPSIPRLASGGVVTGPSLAMIGEGRNNEAVVPLPNNREIPVQLNGSSGDNIKIEQNFDFRGADSGAISQLRQEARAIEERTFNRVFSEINRGGKFAKISGRR